MSVCPSCGHENQPGAKRAERGAAGAGAAGAPGWGRPCFRSQRLRRPARFYAQALELWPTDDAARPGLLFRYGKSRFHADAAGADVLATARDELLRAGDRETAAEAEILLADFAFHEGERDRVSEHCRWDEAGREATEWIRECEEGSPHYHETSYRLFRGLIRFARGDVDGALEDADAGVAAARRSVDPQELWPTLSVRARLLFEAGRTAEAAADVDELLTKLWRSVGRLGHVDLVWVVGSLGRRDDFLEAVERSSRRSRWLDAARAVATEEFELAADLFASARSARRGTSARARPSSRRRRSAAAARQEPSD